MTRFHGYSRLPDLGKILREAAASHVNRRKIYMLPSMSNEEILLDMLRGSDSYFGEKPEAWSWAGMYSRLVPRGDLRRGIDPPDQSMILRHLIGQTLADLDSRGMTVPHGVRRRGFLEILSAAIRELLLEDVPPDRLLYGPSKGSEKRGAEPRELLYSIYSDYLAYLEDNGLADNSQMPALTRESVMSTRPDYLDSCVIYWVGFMSFTGAQLRLIKELNGLVDRWGMDLEMEFYTPDSGLEGFRDAASQLGLVSSGQYEKGGMIVSVEASDAFEQYDAIAMEIAMARAGSGELADILNGLTRSDQGRIDALLDIGIMADPHKVQLITSALRRRGVGFQQRSEVQVSETAVIEFCRRAWEAYSRGWPTRRTSHILRHPLFGVSSLDEKRSAVELPEGIESWRKFLSGVEGDSSTPSSLKNLESLNSFCEYLNDPRGHVREEILGALLALADDGEWESRLAAEVGKYAELDGAVRLVSSTRLEIAEKLEMMREQRPALGEAGDQRFSGVDALDCLLEWARGATTALQQPQSNVVVLYDSPPPVLAEHSIWIMTDVDPSRFPGSMSGQALLDADLRDNVNRRVDDSDDAVHLPTFHEKREQQEALFRRLLSVGSVVTIIARSASDSEGRPQEDSPFVQALFSDAASRWVRLAHIAGAAWSSLESERAGLYAIDRGKFPRVATDDLRMPAKVRSEKIRVAPSHIDDWLQCPFSYWCGHVARIEAPRDDVGLYDKIIQGALMHATWKGVWERYLSHLEGEASSLHDLLLSSWDSEMSRLSVEYPFISDARFAAPIAKIRGMMLGVAEEQDKAEMRASEAGFVRVGAEFERSLPEYRLTNLSFFGKADRIDLWQTPDSLAAVIVDYKLGNSGWYGDSLQLAAYAAIMRDAASKGDDIPRVVGYCYVGHADQKARGAWSPEIRQIYKATQRGRVDDLEERIAEAAKAMNEMDSALPNGIFTANYESNACVRCSYQAICRRSERFGARSSEEVESDDGTDDESDD